MSAIWGKGLVFLFGRLGMLFKFIGPWFFKGMTGIFIVYTFVIEWQRHGIVAAGKSVLSTVFSAEMTIREITMQAVTAPATYTFIDFLAIITSFYIIYKIASFIRHIFNGFLGAQARDDNFVVDMSLLLGLVCVAGIELLAISVLEPSQLGKFWPLWSGTIYMIRNLGAVILFHIGPFVPLSFLVGQNAVAAVQNITQNISNTTAS